MSAKRQNASVFDKYLRLVCLMSKTHLEFPRVKPMHVIVLYESAYCCARQACSL
jgi:hypothetical protein